MYILEGNIGVGKSTFIKLITNYFKDIIAIPEPKDNWASHDYGQSLLENFYKDFHRWSYTLETLAMFCRVKDHLREQNEPNKNRIMERSVYSGHYCFAKNGYAHGYQTPMEWQIYLQWVNFLVLKQCKPPKGFIYLQATPDTCFARVQKRNRKGEEALTLDYLTQIGYWHDKFLLEKEEIAPNLTSVPVLILDCNQDFMENPNLMKIHAEKVHTFMQETQTMPVSQTTSINNAAQT